MILQISNKQDKEIRFFANMDRTDAIVNFLIWRTRTTALARGRALILTDQLRTDRQDNRDDARALERERDLRVGTYHIAAFGMPWGLCVYLASVTVLL